MEGTRRLYHLDAATAAMPRCSALPTQGNGSPVKVGRYVSRGPEFAQPAVHRKFIGVFTGRRFQFDSRLARDRHNQDNYVEDRFIGRISIGDPVVPELVCGNRHSCA